MNVSLAKLKDWWWTSDNGLVDNKTLKPLSSKKVERVLVQGKDFVLIWKQSGVVKTKIIKQDKHGKITLGHLSQALVSICSKTSKDISYGLEPFDESFHESEWAVSVFLGFDH